MHTELLNELRENVSSLPYQRIVKVSDLLNNYDTRFSKGQKIAFGKTVKAAVDNGELDCLEWFCRNDNNHHEYICTLNADQTVFA